MDCGIKLKAEEGGGLISPYTQITEVGDSGDPLRHCTPPWWPLCLPSRPSRLDVLSLSARAPHGLPDQPRISAVDAYSVLFARASRSRWLDRCKKRVCCAMSDFLHFSKHHNTDIATRASSLRLSRAQRMTFSKQHSCRAGQRLDCLIV